LAYGVQASLQTSVINGRFQVDLRLPLEFQHTNIASQIDDDR